MADAALDNDVILKGSSYGILTDLLAALPGGPHSHGVLGAARFMLPKALARKHVVRTAEALIDLNSALATLEVLEPSETEQRIAADLQFNAQQAGLPLDAGEAQLTAMLVMRELHHLLTGDKRAIAALALTQLPEPLSRDRLAHKLICLEQAIWALLEHQDTASVRAAICAEPAVDTQLRICFSCLAPEVEEASWREGLRSAIEAVRANCPDLLARI